MVSAGGRAYNRGVGAEPPPEPAPGQGVRGVASLKLKAFLAFGRPTVSAKFVVLTVSYKVCNLMSIN